jgi:hypothetical protein
LLGVFGIKLDVAHNSLWAGTAALPEAKDYTAAEKGHAALVEFDLATGRVKRSFAVPVDGRDHVLGDPFLAADGTVFAADSTNAKHRLAKCLEAFRRTLNRNPIASSSGASAASLEGWHKAGCSFHPSRRSLKAHMNAPTRSSG